MEEVPGIRGAIPQLVPYPPESVRSKLPPNEWQACLDSWLFSLEFRLRLTDDHFSKFRLSQNASGTPFLVSYLKENISVKPGQTHETRDSQLYRPTYLLLRRLLLKTVTPYDYDPLALLSLMSMTSQVYQTTSDWAPTVNSTWKRSVPQCVNAVEMWKSKMMQSLANNSVSSEMSATLRQMSILAKTLPEVGAALMTGTDYLESLIAAYEAIQINLSGHETQKIITEHVYYCFRSLMSDASNHSSLLLDHLYYVKSEADQSQKTKPQQATLCSSLVCTTSFLRRLAADPNVAVGKRGQALTEALNVYRQHTLHLHPPMQSSKRKASKGKGKASAREEMHIHKAGQISQIHDLFPELHNAYIIKLLDHFNDNVEAVIAALLEPESLPAELKDQGQEMDTILGFEDSAHETAPKSTPPRLPQRKNVFDGDDFDKLRISSSKLHRGRKDLSAELPQSTDEHTRSKAAIMAALAAFDLDDDERDDTYDVADVGGTVDQSVDTDSRPRGERQPDQNPSEELLYRAWKDSHELFERDSKTRVSRIRQDLKRDTGMSDEQIEGWAIMLKKDPALQIRLERKYAAINAFQGNQSAIAQTRWQSNASGTDSQEDAEGDGSDGRRAGQAQIRGARTWGRGRGGSTSGPGHEASTQAARRRKEQGRGRGGASHHRREGRAKKMSRGMAGPPA